MKTLKDYPSVRITLETGDCAYSNMPIEDYETIISSDLVRLTESNGADGVAKFIELNM